MNRSTPILILFASLMVVPACRQEPQAPAAPPADKSGSRGDTPSPAAPSNPPPTSPTPAASTARPAEDATATAPEAGRWTSPQVSWALPPGWTQEAGGNMRFMTIKPARPDATVAVSHFPGDVGGALPNVNRWRRQLGLEPITEADLGAHTQALTIGPISAALYDLRNPQSNQGMLVASLPCPQETWFVKLEGPPAALDELRSDFTSFLETIRFPE